jgi:hypothetical protein
MKKALPFLAVAFSGFLVYLFDKIWGNSIDWTKVKSIKFGEFLTKEIELYQIFIFILLSVLIYIIGKKIIGNKKQYYSKKQQKLRAFNNSVIQEPNILMRWKVYFDYDTPFIADLTPFCQKHEGPPIRFIHNSCPVKNCENSRINFNEMAMKNAIESDLIDRWEKMK